MAPTRKYIQHYRTSGTTQPQASEMVHGEIAIGYQKSKEKMFIKNTANTITEFSSDEQLKEIRDDQDIKVAEASGLVVDQTDDSGVVNYQYQPSSTLLSEFTNMNASVDFLAEQLQDCYDAIEEIKSNVYIIRTNFKVEPNSGFTAYNLSYQCVYNDNPTTPKSCTITKYVNDGEGVVVLSNVETSSASTESTITGCKERYVLEVIPDLIGALNSRREETRYMCYVGASSTTTMTAQILETFTKKASNGRFFTASVDTQLNDYIWIVVPSYISIAFVTSNGITVTLNNEVQTVANSFGTFKCYRSYKALASESWPLIIHNISFR